MIDEKKLIERLENIQKNDCKSLMERVWFDGILAIVETQPKVGEWIPVEEGLPEEHEIVDITYVNETYEYEDDGDLFYIEMLTDIAYYEDGEWFDEFDELIIEDVIAWKPRPEPYRKEDNK